MAVDPIVADTMSRQYLRIAACDAEILDERPLLQSLRARLLAELVMCDPAYVLTVQDREQLLLEQIAAGLALLGTPQIANPTGNVVPLEKP
jgi:hypothetical protein